MRVYRFLGAVLYAARYNPFRKLTLRDMHAIRDELADMIREEQTKNLASARMRLEGTLQRANEINANNRVYTSEVLENLELHPIGVSGSGQFDD